LCLVLGSSCVVRGASFFVLVLSAAVLVIVIEICEMAVCGEFHGIVPSFGFRVPRVEFNVSAVGVWRVVFGSSFFVLVLSEAVLVIVIEIFGMAAAASFE